MLPAFPPVGGEALLARRRSAALHTADIDIVHHSTRTPVEVGGVRIHGPNHVQYNAEAIPGTSVCPNHEWVEGLIMTYRLTGEERYLRLAEGMADHILRARRAGWISPAYNVKWNGARNLAWPILLLTMVYDETGNVRYREEAAAIVRDLGSLQRENGSVGVLEPHLVNAVFVAAEREHAPSLGKPAASTAYTIKSGDSVANGVPSSVAIIRAT